MGCLGTGGGGGGVDGMGLLKLPWAWDAGLASTSFEASIEGFDGSGVSTFLAGASPLAFKKKFCDCFSESMQYYKSNPSLECSD